MASFDYRLNPLYAIKECSSCGALYTTDYCCSKGSLEDKILVPKTPDSSQRPPQDCVTLSVILLKCGNPVEGPNCQGCALWRKKLKEVWFTICHENGIYQDLLNTYESSDDDTNVVNAPRESFVVKQDPLSKNTMRLSSISVMILLRVMTILLTVRISIVVDASPPDAEMNELAHIISPPEYDCFYFKSEPDPGELTSIVDSGIRENVLPTTNVNLPFEDAQSPLLAYVVWIFLAFLTYPVTLPYLLSCGNEYTIFDPGISIYHSFMPGLPGFLKPLVIAVLSFDHKSFKSSASFGNPIS
ncbi:hypothetical protein Tco_0889728 [Tanacetum coccineum]